MTGDIPQGKYVGLSDDQRKNVYWRADQAKIATLAYLRNDPAMLCIVKCPLIRPTDDTERVWTTVGSMRGGLQAFLKKIFGRADFGEVALTAPLHKHGSAHWALNLVMATAIGPSTKNASISGVSQSVSYACMGKPRNT